MNDPLGEPSVAMHTTGWNVGLQRNLKIDVNSVDFIDESPRVVSVAIRPTRIATRGYSFRTGTAERITWNAHKPTSPGMGKPASGTQPSGDSAELQRTSRKLTRLKPPGDIVKLEDRLFYLLQPPLETWLHGESLQFPFDPFPYQWDGIAFLYTRFAAILADEMGLGKTMQAISTMRLLLRTGEVGSILLVCPKPLVTNWQREFSVWAPEIPVIAIGGDQKKRQWQWELTNFPVKIANYESLLRDRDVVVDGGLQFDLMVLDEAQRIKNRSGTTSQTVCAVSRRRSWALTGTPIENSTEDLVGIFEFLAPGFLNVQMSPRKMGQSVSDYILRRTKDKVLTDMPPKLFRDADLELSPEQRTTYDKAESEGVIQLTELGNELTVQHVFELVLRLKQICNHDPATRASSKLERLTADLEEIAASGQKAIVFSQWVETLLWLSAELQRFGPLEYHGRIPHAKRDPILKAFKEDPAAHVLLMSYGAGSVGLNLQFCQYVFLFDRWWNPAVEDQAINRAHRIGAAGPVTITRFISVGTIEQRIDEVLTSKRELFDAVLSQAGPPRSQGLNEQEIYGLFNLSMPHRGRHAAA
ncbi:MAG: DEAD/DEAH box helicase [Pirellulaceae bacterium]